MPELSDLTVEEARARMLAAAPRLKSESVALDPSAVGRVLAEAVKAAHDQPPFDASAMDGYAVHPGDPAWPAFRIVGESAAGRPHGGDLRAGETIRVFTGGVVPPGLCIVVQERARRDGNAVRFGGAPPGAGDNVRSQGGDFRRDEILLAAGQRLDPWRIGLAAAAGWANAVVSIQPRVAILVTGEEITTPGSSSLGSIPTPGAIFDSGGPALAARLAAWGGDAFRTSPVGDSEDAILSAFAGLEADLIVTVGGASVGDHDLLKPSLRSLGLDLAVERVNLRPGRPTWFGSLKDGRRVLGLPGNPASALVAAELFLRPLVLAMQGADAALPTTPARLLTPLPATGPREHWMRAGLESDGEGRLGVRPAPDQDSGRMSVFASADALLRRPANAIAAGVGEGVEVLRLERL